MAKYSLLLLLTLTACGGKKKSDGGANETVAKMTDFKTKICACKDVTCVRPLIDEFTVWTAKFGADTKAQEQVTPEQEKQLDALNRQIMACATGPAKAAAPPAGDKATAPAPAPGGDVPTEVQLNFHRIEKNAKTGFITNTEFPKGKAASLPAADCCKTGGTCAPEKDAFAKDKAWAEIDFDVTEPNQFHYTYESDGKTFHAEATGDPDCDGTSATYKLEGKAENGNVVTAITGP